MPAKSKDSHEIASHITDSLRDNGYAHCPLLLRDIIGLPTDKFLRSWKTLGEDPYFDALTGTQGSRTRTIGKLIYNPRLEQFTSLDDGGFMQAQAINSIFGGVARSFQLIEEELITDILLLNFIKRNVAAFENISGLDKTCKWNIILHQIRVTCPSGSTVNPAPEGIHQDGHDYLSIHFINSDNISGGESIVYDAQDCSELFRRKLTYQGESIFLDDRRVKHSITSIAPIESESVGYRDVLIIDYEVYSPDSEIL